jgi:hypothetical protein
MISEIPDSFDLHLLKLSLSIRHADAARCASRVARSSAAYVRQGAIDRSSVAGMVSASVVRVLQALRGLGLVAAANWWLNSATSPRLANPCQLMTRCPARDAAYPVDPAIGADR